MSADMEERMLALIAKLEVRIQQLDAIDDRIARLERTERALTNLSWKLAASRFVTSWVPGAMAGAISGGVVALLVLGAKSLGLHQ